MEAALEDLEQRTGRPLYSVFRYYVDHPGVRSAEIAAIFSDRLGIAITAEWVRKVLMQARRMFQESLLIQVERSLDVPSLDNLEEELIHIGLHRRCHDAIRRRRHGA